MESIIYGILALIVGRFLFGDSATASPAGAMGGDGGAFPQLPGNGGPQPVASYSVGANGNPNAFSYVDPSTGQPATTPVQVLGNVQTITGGPAVQGMVSGSGVGAPAPAGNAGWGGGINVTSANGLAVGSVNALQQARFSATGLNGGTSAMGGGMQSTSAQGTVGVYGKANNDYAAAHNGTGAITEGNKYINLGTVQAPNWQPYDGRWPYGGNTTAPQGTTAPAAPGFAAAPTYSNGQSFDWRR